MARLRYNGLKATLGGSGLTNVATAVTFGAALTYGNGVNVPTIVAPDYIPLTILSTSGLVSEIVYLTAYTAAGTTGTITRGQETTSGVAHSLGDAVVHDLTAFDFGVATSFATAWTAAVGSPTVGAGTNVGRYALLGPLCYFEFVLTLGTGFGVGTSGQYAFTAPVTAAYDATIWGEIRLSGGNPFPLIADLVAGSNSIPPKALPTTAGAVTVNMSPTVPVAPASGTVIRFAGVYFWTT